MSKLEILNEIITLSQGLNCISFEHLGGNHHTTRSLKRDGELTMFAIGLPGKSDPGTTCARRFIVT
jgi:hypothetical protein